MLSMLGNENSRTDTFADLISQCSVEPNCFDQLSCSLHPGFKPQALCPEENFHPSLLCVKCMLDPEIEKRFNIDTVVAIQDVINKVTTLNDMEAQAQTEREDLKNMIYEFTSKDYLRGFERHVEGQMKKLRREIERTKESLDETEVRFRKVFDKQQKSLRNKEEDLKKKINEYVADQEQLKQFLNLTPQQIMEKIKKISSVKEYEKFIKTLYQRECSDQRGIQSAMIDSIMENMDDLRGKVNKMKSYKIQTTVLEEIRQKLGSMEFVDQSLQTVAELDSKLMTTLEKVRDAGEKIKQQDTLTEANKGDQVGEIKEKLNNLINKASKETEATKEPKAANRMEVEPVSSDSHSRGESAAEKETVNGQYAKKTEEKLPSKGSEELEIVPQGFDIDKVATATHNYKNVGHSEYKAAEGEQTHRKQKIDAESYRMIETRKSERIEIVPDDDETKNLEGPVIQGQQEEIQFVEQQGNTVVEQRGIFSETVNMQKFDCDILDHIAFPKENGIDIENQVFEGISPRQDQEDIQPENDEEQKLNESLVSPAVESFNLSEEEEAVELETNEPAKSLHDWIDRRLTGHFVYINTLQRQEGEQIDNALQEKWENIEETEREEYRNIAQKAISTLKNEYQDIERESSEFANAQKVIEEKIKEVRRDSVIEEMNFQC